MFRSRRRALSDSSDVVNRYTDQRVADSTVSRLSITGMKTTARHQIVTRKGDLKTSHPSFFLIFYMERKRKYTHITAKVSPIVRAISKWRMDVTCGITLSEAYWRLCEGKGLVNRQDKELLDIWSDIVTLCRRFTGAPLPIDYELSKELRGIRNDLFERMEKYRDWLAKGNQVVRLSDLCHTEGTRRELEYAIRMVAQPLYAGQEKDDMAVWDKLKAVSGEQADEIAQAVNYDQVLAIAQEEGQKLDKELDSIKKRIANLRRENAKLEKQGAELKILMENLDKIDDLSTAYLMAGHPGLPRTALYQIRADMDHRKSDTELIGHTLYLLWDVPSKTDEAHRAIMDKNLAVLDELQQWKAKKKAEWKADKEANPKAHYDGDALFAETCSYIERLAIPDFPDVIEEEEPEEPLSAKEQREKEIEELMERRQIKINFDEEG